MTSGPDVIAVEADFAVDDIVVDLAATPYGGLLRLGAVLTTHALPQSSSPIHRGKLVRERLLCEDLPPPPSNLDTSPPPVDPTKSTRERYAEHAANEAAPARRRMGRRPR